MFKSFSQISEQAFLIDYGSLINQETNNNVINHFKYIQNLNYKFILNIVPSFNKLLILFDTRYKKDTLNLINQLKSNKINCVVKTKKHLIKICYDEEFALDKNYIEQNFNLNFETLINIHLNTNFHAYMLGFLPGLPFLGTMKVNFSIPRKNSPRIKVPGSSVGIVNNLCVIYPFDTPGGWNIIGKAKVDLFNINKAKLCSITPGDQIIFKRVTKKEI